VLKTVYKITQGSPCVTQEFRKLKAKHTCNSKYVPAANLNHQKLLHILFVAA